MPEAQFTPVPLGGNAEAPRPRTWLLTGLVLVLPGGPAARRLARPAQPLARRALRRQAADLNSVITSIRGYYANNVVGRMLAAHGQAHQVSHNYDSIPGAIPIPATLSLELGRVISEQQSNIPYRFVSDLPFKNRAAARAGRLRAARAGGAARRAGPAMTEVSWLAA